MQDVQPNKSTPNTALVPLTESLGTLLMRTRESQSLTLREAATRIGVEVSVLQSLEDDDFKQIGAPVFTRSYLKRYAILLNLPEDTVIAQYQQLGVNELPPLKVTRSIKPQAKMSDIRWISYPLVVVLAGWLGWLTLERLVNHFDSVETAKLLEPSSTPGNDTTLALPQQPNTLPLPNENPAPTAPTAPTVATVAPTPALTPVPTAAPTRSSPIAPIAEAAPIEPSPAADTPETVSLAAIAIEAPLTATTTAAVADTPVQLADGAHELVLQLSEDCWVEIKDANNDRLAYGILKANSVNKMAGKPPFRFTLGNAGAATITLNGTTVAKDVYIPKRGSVSRFTLEPQG